MSVLLLVLLAAAPAPTPAAATPLAPASKAPARPAADAPRDAPGLPAATVVLRRKADHGTSTQCVLCHATSSWVDVRFNHDRTGFPLSGAHTTVTCKECHQVDFVRPLPRTCVGCHTDVHAGDLGARCEECHDTGSWRSRLDVDAHRRTNFPLLGAHAALPCVACHAEARERRFTRAMVTCGSCHQGDYLQTQQPNHRTASPPFDPERCQLCHGAFRFRPARYAAHDRCYVTTQGPHAGVACTSCHGQGAFANVTIGSCASLTGQLQCTSCHEHLCPDMDQLHTVTRQVPGYSCAPRKCYECHQNDFPRTP